MRKVTSDFKMQIEKDNRNYYEWVDITLKDGTVLNLTNKDIWNYGIKIEDSVSDTSEFQIGTAIINKATVTLNNIYDDFTDYDFTDAEIVIYIGYNIKEEILRRILQDTKSNNIQDTTGSEIITLVNGSIVEKVKMFTGTVIDSPYQNSSIITLTCEDNMMKFDRDYSESKLIYPATRAQILRDACENCDVQLETLEFKNSDYIVNTRPSDEKLTFRQVIAWTAQIGGQWCRCNSDGKLCCSWYDLKNYEDESRKDDYFDILKSNDSVTVNSDDVIITGIRVTAYEENQSDEEETETVLYGEEGYVIEIAENKLIEKGTANTVAGMIGEQVAGIRFRPFSANTLNNPTYEAGDICVVIDRKGNEYKSFITSSTFQVGNTHLAQCGAKSAAKNSSKRYSIFSQAQVENRKNFKREKTEREKAVEELNKTLENASGMYPTEVVQPDGSSILYVHDKKNLSDSKNVFKITSDAVGFSTDGGKTYPFGFTLTGDFITRILYAIGINADYINAGAITVKDNQGNIIFQADFENNRVIISGEHVQIGGKPISDVVSGIEKTANEANNTANNAMNAAALAKNMTMQLSNEYQAIPVDSSGKYSTFPSGVETKPIVMYGTSDITNECTYTITKSDSVTGSWNSSEKKYTATGLTSDSGWVDIRATYAGTLSVSKRFTIAKLYAGNDGEDGKNGKDGTNGTSVSIVENNVAYQASSSGTVPPTGNWTSDIPSLTNGQYLWTKVYTKFSDGKSSTSYSVSYKASDGKNGTPGTDGVSPTVTSSVNEYVQSTSGTTVPSSGWSTTPPSANPGQYIWTRTTITYSDKKTAVSYSVSKNGATGSPGRTYFMEVSSVVVKRSQNDEISPNYITLSGYYRDGTSTGRTQYSGRFKIEETIDGQTWKTVYTSSKDESSVTQNLYSTTATSSGGAISNASGNRLGIPKDVVAIRCTLYASGGTSQQIDTQTISVVVDVDALTHEEIFNLLTNNGEVKGIYKEGNQLYISFTYAKGGILTLGGRGNGNGLLKIYNNLNAIAAMMNNEGLCFGNFLDSSEGRTELPDFNSNVKMLIKNGILQSIDPHFYGTIYLNRTGMESDRYHEDYPLIKDTSLTTGRTSLQIGVKSSNNSSDYTKFGILKEFSVDADDITIRALGKAASNGYARIQGKVVCEDSLRASSFSGVSGNFTGTVEIYQLNTTGSKKRVVETEEYERRSLYCYEMPSPMFGDIGEATTDETGTCYVYIDDIFEKTVNTNIEYQVFLQKEEKGDVWVKQKEKKYFVVEGTPNMKFSWEIKIKQRDFEMDRLEIANPNEKEFEDVDYETQGQNIFEEFIKEAEEN